MQGIAYYDAAIAIADRIVEYTEYVRPICLPMTPVDDEDAFADDLVTLAGKNSLDSSTFCKSRWTSKVWKSVGPSSPWT